MKKARPKYSPRKRLDAKRKYTARWFVPCWARGYGCMPEVKWLALFPFTTRATAATHACEKGVGGGGGEGGGIDPKTCTLAPCWVLANAPVRLRTLSDGVDAGPKIKRRGVLLCCASFFFPPPCLCVPTAARTSPGRVGRVRGWCGRVASVWVFLSGPLHAGGTDDPPTRTKELSPPASPPPLPLDTPKQTHEAQPYGHHSPHTHDRRLTRTHAK